jgi:hypothetical protein
MIAMTSHVRFAKPIISSFSRRPTRAEFLYMNLLERHIERCRLCEKVISGRLPRDCGCRRGSILMDLVLRCFVVERNGKIYSTKDEFWRPVRVEISRSYWAVHGLLRAFYPRSYRYTYAFLF